MKYLLLFAFMACGYGQYPSLNYMKYYNNRYEQTKDTTPIKIYNDLDTLLPFLIGSNEIQWGSYDNDNYVEMRVIDNDTTIIVSGDSLTAIKLLFKAWNMATQIDSSKYYYEKQLYWQKKMDKESRRLDRLKTPQISQKLLDYQDSLIHYQLLLLKKIKNGSNKMDK